MNCKNCGGPLEDDNEVCPYCGAAIPPSNEAHRLSRSEPENIARENYLTILWKGRFVLVDLRVTVNINGQHVGDYSYKEGFSIVVPIKTSEVLIEASVKQGITFRSAACLHLSPGRDYTCTLTLSGTGEFDFDVDGEGGDTVVTDNLGYGLWCLFFMIPIVGLVYSVVVRKPHPGKARKALIASFVGIATGIGISLVKSMS